MNRHKIVTRAYCFCFLPNFSNKLAMMRFFCFSRSSINYVTSDNLICSSRVNFTSILRKSHVALPINIITLCHSCRTFENFITTQNVENVARKESVSTVAVSTNDIYDSSHLTISPIIFKSQNTSRQEPFQSKSESPKRNWINESKADSFNVNKYDYNISPRDLKESPSEISEINFKPNDISLERQIDFQKLVDAVDKYGRKWNYISKEIFNYNFSPELLQYKYEDSIRCYGPNFWTTRETTKLIDAVTSFGEEWKLISSDIFKFRRSAFQCKSKWKRLLGYKIKFSPRNSSEYKRPPKFQNSQSFPPRLYLQSEDNITLDFLPEDPHRKRNNYDDLFADLYKEWTDHDTRTLIKAVNQHGENWELITERYFSGNQSVKLKWAKFVSSESDEFLKMKNEVLANNTKDKIDDTNPMGNKEQSVS
ncbi:hypothetical protein Glove_585g60 [Diversispora epigaea]|uniref:Myb-like domain-containing protein n=1 Tax=Diversispora epigaea TaxID=1348612 RepID=A0A397GEG4_9GLOM|nr:hypothetical protein Glove_585g60 [Diversispora epigaea]